MDGIIPLLALSNGLRLHTCHIAVPNTASTIPIEPLSELHFACFSFMTPNTSYIGTTGATMDYQMPVTLWMVPDWSGTIVLIKMEKFSSSTEIRSVKVTTTSITVSGKSGGAAGAVHYYPLSIFMFGE